MTTSGFRGYASPEHQRYVLMTLDRAAAGPSPVIGLTVHSAACVDSQGKIECECGLADFIAYGRMLSDRDHYEGMEDE